MNFFGASENYRLNAMAPRMPVRRLLQISFVAFSLAFLASNSWSQEPEKAPTSATKGEPPKQSPLQSARSAAEKALQAARKARDPKALAAARLDWRKALRVAVLDAKKIFESTPSPEAERRFSALRFELLESLLVDPGLEASDPDSLAALARELESEPQNRSACLRLRLSFASPEERCRIIQGILEACPPLNLAGGETFDLRPARLGAGLTFIAIIEPRFAPASQRVHELARLIEQHRGRSYILALSALEAKPPSRPEVYENPEFKDLSTLTQAQLARPDSAALDPRERLAMSAPILLIVLHGGKVVSVDPYASELAEWLEEQAR